MSKPIEATAVAPPVEVPMGASTTPTTPTPAPPVEVPMGASTTPTTPTPAQPVEVPMGASTTPTTPTPAPPVEVPMGASTTPTTPTPETSGMAIASMVCGIVGIFFSIFLMFGLFVGIILGLLAIIFGRFAMRRIHQKPQELQGLCQAKAGITCGIIAVVLWIIIIILLNI